MDEFKSVDIKGCLAKARDLFLRAEFAVKKYERIGLESQIGAINELRYAGHHLMKASEGRSQEEIERHALCVSFVADPLRGPDSRIGRSRGHSQGRALGGSEVDSAPVNRILTDF